MQDEERESDELPVRRSTRKVVRAVDFEESDQEESQPNLKQQKGQSVTQQTAKNKQTTKS